MEQEATERDQLNLINLLQAQAAQAAAQTQAAAQAAVQVTAAPGAGFSPKVKLRGALGQTVDSEVNPLSDLDVAAAYDRSRVNMGGEPRRD